MLCRHPKLRTDFEQAAREVFAVIEKEIEALPHKKDNSGSTALVVLISEEKVTAVNLGDSRAILVAADGSTVQINK
jgi:serine/threonine protein phosphatase PrpC